MALISTSATFSVRGFGGIGNAGSDNPNLFYDVYIYSNTTGTIVDFNIDSGNNIVGIYSTTSSTPTSFPSSGYQTFCYNQYGVLKYWYDGSSNSWELMNVPKIDNSCCIISDIAGLFNRVSIASFNGPTMTTNGRDVGTGSSGGDYKIIKDTTDDGYFLYRLVDGGSRVDKFNSTFTSVLSTYYSSSWDPLYNPTGYSVQYQDGLFVKIYGKPAAGSYTSWMGTCTSSYNSGTAKAISSGTVRQVYSVGSYCYIVYTNAGSIGLVRMDSSFNLVNNQTYTESGQTITYTSSCIDYTNNYIYITYNYGSVDRIVKLSINGVVQWTRTLTSSAGGLLGIKKITTNNSGSRYYISTATKIFEFYSDGSISGTGTYTVNSITYTYSTGTQWINGSSNLLALTGSTAPWSMTLGSASALTYTYAVTSPTPAITVNTF